ncbi:hypothetical protein [Curtobacterium sp. ISL-83]|uniref:hypothetical protein n=1 Tax=Curtobacterium sp. ISL-83 TaxID=2819145 RepID=UPI001BE67F6F|nr:hypothetical protein [Curtobacterium sp. ISL-83]MBT2501654.1 hypothetical protein [Curtobacterium sp. ISL-83]
MTATTTPTRLSLRSDTRRIPRSPLPSLVAAVLAFAAILLIATGATGTVRTAVVLVALLVVPGLPVVRLLGVREPVSRGALVVATSVAIEAVLALAMVWTKQWTPLPAAGLLLLLTGWVSLGHGVQTVRTAHRPLAGAVGRDRLATAVLVRSVVGVGVLVTGIALWAVGNAQTGSSPLGEWGLLTALPPIWWIGAVAVIAVALVSLVDRRYPTIVRAVSAAALLAVMYGTTNLVATEPRPPWVFKHIAVTAYIGQHGAVDPSIDIYNRWPGFFSVSAFLGAATGHLDAMDPVRWAELAFALTDGALVLGIGRALGLRGRWAWVAAVLFSAANWVGQDYYSPQAFAFMLFLSTVLVALTALRRSPNAIGRWVATTASRLSRARRAPVVETVPTPTRTVTITAVTLVLVLQFVMTASHQLTPFVVVAALAPLLVLGFLRPWWLVFPLLAMPLLYLVPNLGYIEKNFGLTTGFDPVSNVTAASTSIALPSIATTLQSRSVLALTALVAVIALVGLVRMVRSGHVRQALVVAWFAVSPIVLVLGQSYGGEAKFRVVLFSAPFLAIAATRAFHGRGVRLVAMALVLTVTTGLFIGATFQAEQANRTAPGEVAAATWLDSRFAADDSLTTVGTFPDILGPHYDNYFRHWGQVATLQDAAAYFPKGLTPADLRTVLGDRSFGGDSWLVFSAGQRADAIARGSVTGAQIDAIERSVASEGTLRYDRDGVRIYEVSRAA